MSNSFEKEFAWIEQLFYNCEADSNLGKAENLLRKIEESTDNADILAKVYGKLAQVETYRYDYVPEKERLAVAEKGVKLAKKGLGYDENNIDANAWAAAVMGLHGIEMGILSSLFYVGPIKKHAGKALETDEAYHYAQPHLIMGELFRLTPPSPVGMRDMSKALEHLLRSTALGSDDPQARFHLAELYKSLRKKDLAKKEINILLEQDIKVRGPIYARIWKEKARKLLEKLD